MPNHIIIIINHIIIINIMIYLYLLNMIINIIIIHYFNIHTHMFIMTAQ